mmetsp:Transcript_88179/g.128934  ORF Transcript_88179/g.128934 Transcript_88179/m.128934 type:complete len:157 (+) Transcript_88179:66-536(+)
MRELVFLQRTTRSTHSQTSTYTRQRQLTQQRPNTNKHTRTPEQTYNINKHPIIQYYDQQMEQTSDRGRQGYHLLVVDLAFMQRAPPSSQMMLHMFAPVHILAAVPDEAAENEGQSKRVTGKKVERGNGAMLQRGALVAAGQNEETREQTRERTRKD